MNSKINIDMTADEWRALCKAIEGLGPTAATLAAVATAAPHPAVAQVTITCSRDSARELARLAECDGPAPLAGARRNVLHALWKVGELA